MSAQDATIMVMNTPAYMGLLSDKAFKEALNQPATSLPPALGASLFKTPAGRLRGHIDGVAVYTYDGEAYAGRTLSKPWILAGFDTDGVQASTQIKHLDAYGQALEYYDYQVESKDPSVIKLITEAATLLVPNHKDGFVFGQVL